MSRPRLTAVALIGAAGISAIALTDAFSVALTDEPSGASEEYGVTSLYVLSGLVHAGAYLAFAAVLRQRSAQIDGASRFRRVVRVVLTLLLVVLAATMLIGTTFSVATGDVPDNAAYGAVAGTAFLLMFVASVALGISLLRRPEPRLAAWTLTAILGALLLTILLGALGSPWAHPAYIEVLAAFGLAFLGLAPRQGKADNSPAEEPTAEQLRLLDNRP